MNYVRTKKKKKGIANFYFYLQFASSFLKVVDGTMEKRENLPRTFPFFFLFIYNRNPIGIEAIFHLLTRIDTVFSFFSFLGEEIHASTARVDKFEDATHPRAIHPTVTRFAKGSGNCHEITRKLMQHALNA